LPGVARFWPASPDPEIAYGLPICNLLM
jgi:hypothetical protein